MHKITDFLRTSHTCLLLVSPEIHRLEDAVDELLSLHNWPRLSIGRELGSALLSETPQHRPHTANQWMKARLGEMAPGPVVCAETALLFEPALQLDPLRLVRDVSRVTRLVVAWPGSYVDEVLTYAVPEHSHYRTWRNPEVDIEVFKE